MGVSCSGYTDQRLDDVSPGAPAPLGTGKLLHLVKSIGGDPTVMSWPPCPYVNLIS